MDNLNNMAMRLWTYYVYLSYMLGLPVTKAQIEEESQNRSLLELLEEYKEKERRGEIKSTPFSLHRMFYHMYDNGIRSLPANALTGVILGYRYALMNGVNVDIGLWNRILEPNAMALHCLEGFAPNESQLSAIRSAMSHRISIVVGPPGCGKTKTILDMMSTITANGRSVAMVSSNNSAIENVEENLLSDFDEVEERNRYNLKRRFLALGNSAKRKRLINESIEDSDAFVETRNALPDMLAEVDIPNCRNKHVYIRDNAFAITSTIHSLANCLISTNGPFVFDYVIIDESSQVTTLAGMVAMSMARQLILVGDPDQIPPVIPGIDSSLSKRLAGELDLELAGDELGGYRVEDEHSILSLCLNLFGRNNSHYSFLTDHYRCHAGIIGFCREHVYNTGDNLIIKTDMNKISTRQADCPIRVLVYEGNYCETKFYEAAGRPSKNNLRQIEIFVSRELEKLKQDLREREDLNVCFMSPYIGQLLELQNRLAEHGIKCELQGNLPENDEEIVSIPTLTVHRSQGREYERVYFMPAEDVLWEKPWSQKKYLVNVAVSRAKEELVIISSSHIFSKDLQQELLDRGIIETEFYPGGGPDRDFDYLEKLFDYVRDNTSKNDRRFEGEYGFFDAGCKGIFDDKPVFELVRKKHVLEEAKRNGHFNPDEIWTLAMELESSFELFIEQLLCKAPEFEKPGVVLYKGALLKDICEGKELPEDLRGFVSNAASEVDFLICRDDEIVFAIEVDGEYHRNASEDDQAGRDVKKNRVFEALQIPLLRLPTNGETIPELGVADPKGEFYRYISARFSEHEQRSAGCKYKTRTLREIYSGNADEISVTESLLRIKGILCDSYDYDEPCLVPYAKNSEKSLEVLKFGVVKKITGSADHPVIEAAFTGSGSEKISGLREDYYGLNEYMDRVYNEFMKAFRSKKQDFIKSLKKVDYSGNVEGSMYEDPVSISYYILKYTWAYAFKYHTIYKDVLENVFVNPDEAISVLSIGCGNFVDYWGLKYAVGIMGKNVRVSYTGVDAADWGEAVRMYDPADNVKFENKKLSEYLHAKEEIASNLIMFPMSISEIGQRPAEIRSLIDAVRAGKFKSERIVLCVALRESEETSDTDIDSVQRVIEAFERGGYSVDPESTKTVEPEDKLITEIAPEYPVYNPYIMVRMREIRRLDSGFRSIPMTSNKYNRYMIVILRRNDR